VRVIGLDPVAPCATHDPSIGANTAWRLRSSSADLALIAWR